MSQHYPDEPIPSVPHCRHCYLSISLHTESGKCLYGSLSFTEIRCLMCRDELIFADDGEPVIGDMRTVPYCRGCA